MDSGMPTYDDIVKEYRKALDRHADDEPMEPVDYDANDVHNCEFNDYALARKKWFLELERLIFEFGIRVYFNPFSYCPFSERDNISNALFKKSRA